MTYEDRKSLERLYANGAELSDIADTLGVHISTVYRELVKGSTDILDKNGRVGYDAGLAQKATQTNLKCKRSKKKNGDRSTEVSNGV